MAFNPAFVKPIFKFMVQKVRELKLQGYHLTFLDFFPKLVFWSVLTLLIYFFQFLSFFYTLLINTNILIPKWSKTLENWHKNAIKAQKFVFWSFLTCLIHFFFTFYGFSINYSSIQMFWYQNYQNRLNTEVKCYEIPNFVFLVLFDPFDQLFSLFIIFL